MHKKSIVLIGGGGHCKACIDVIEVEGKYNIIGIIDVPENSESNYWLNSILLKNRTERDKFLKFTNEKGIMTRPV